MCYGCQIKVLANMILSTQTWAIVEVICGALSFVTTCVVYRRHGDWLLLHAFSYAIKLFVKFTKETLELQVEVDAT
jgi:hypothetical protein